MSSGRHGAPIFCDARTKRIAHAVSACNAAAKLTKSVGRNPSWERTMIKGCRAYLLAVAIVLGLMGGIAYGGVFNTKHNLSATGLNAASNYSGTREICVFCHTPQNNNANSAVPLWNRNLDPTGFETYDQLGTTALGGGGGPGGAGAGAGRAGRGGARAM